MRRIVFGMLVQTSILTIIEGNASSHRKLCLSTRQCGQQDVDDLLGNWLIEYLDPDERRLLSRGSKPN